MSIQNTTRLLEDVKSLAVHMVDIIKKGHLTFGSVTLFFSLLGDLKNILADAPGSMPELMHLSEDEAGEVTKLAYEIVYAALNAVKS